MTSFGKREDVVKDEPRHEAAERREVVAPKRDDKAHEKAEAHVVPKVTVPPAWLVRCAGCGETFRVEAEGADVQAHEVKRGWTCVGSGHSGAVVAVRSVEA